MRMNNLRGLVRPVTTLALVAMLIFMTVTGRPIPADVMALTVGVISYWYGSRKGDG